MKFALVSQDKTHGVRFWINPEEGDATSFFNWVDVLQGFHFSYDKLREEMSPLKGFDLVMMSGNPYNLKDIVAICDFLKDTKTVTMFWPEGSTQLYDNSIINFSKDVYDAWNACDVMSIAEEDKRSYYESFVTSKTLVRFIHVPMRREMQDGHFFVQQIHKSRSSVLVYGDNNPNHPLIAIAVASRLKMEVIGIDIDRGKINDIKTLFPETRFHRYTKLAQYPFLRILSRCFVNIYPTEWIGSARQQISCAVSGTPCIGNRDSHTQKRLFPKLGTYIYDVDAMQGLIKELSENSILYNEVVKYAWEQSRFYSLEDTVHRMVSVYEEARALKMKVAVPA